jgi:hypothetical protein
VPVTQQTAPSNEPLAKPEFTSLAQKSRESVAKNQSVINDIVKTLPLDEEPTTERFDAVVPPQRPPPEPTNKLKTREECTMMKRAQSFADANADDKLARILRLIEQNKTGYERPAVQDMVLYIFTGVFFLFTFDTFVQLGKSMRPPRLGRTKGSSARS